MECKATSTERKRRAGFTLVELLVSVGLLMIALSGIAALYIYFLKAFAGMENHMCMGALSRYAMDRMTREIRQADGLTSLATNRITLTNVAGGISYTWTWDPTAKTLSRASGTNSEVFLTGCDYLRYDAFTHSAVAGTADFYPTTSPGECKMVQVTWVCSRTVLGHKMNIDEAQSAKVVIRK